MKHTPSPWTWEKIRYPKGGWLLMTPKNGHCIVMDFGRLGIHGAQPRFSDRGDQPLGGVMIDAKELNLNQHPDARLIAAAPVLYDVTKMAIEYIENGYLVKNARQLELLAKLKSAIEISEVTNEQS